MNSTYDDGQERDVLGGAKFTKPERGYIRQSARKHRIRSSQLVRFLLFSTLNKHDLVDSFITIFCLRTEFSSKLYLENSWE